MGGEGRTKARFYCRTIKICCLVINSTYIVPGDRSIMDMGYMHNSHKTLGFIATGGAGNTVTGYILLYPPLIPTWNSHKLSCIGHFL